MTRESDLPDDSPPTATPVSSASGALPAVTVRDVSKRFGGVAALSEVSMTVTAGECHAIIGANGAGKSTLMKTIAGLVVPDSGAVEIGGAVIHHDPHAAREAGVALVHQELSLCPDLSVAENICLGTIPGRRGLINRAAMRARASELLARVGMDLDVDINVGTLPTAIAQFVEIAKALQIEPKVLILDEPTASLTPEETERLLAMLTRLREAGMTVIYISHRLPEIYALCGRATVLRDGHLVDTIELSGTSADALVELMVGRPASAKRAPRTRAHAAVGDPVLAVHDLRAPGVHGTSLEVRAGEVLGLAGLVGAGRTELLRAIVGLEPKTGGVVEVHADGRRHTITSYGSAMRAGIGYVPEERRVEGVVQEMSISENFTLCSPRTQSRFGHLSRRRMERLAKVMGARVGLRPAAPTSPVSSLSGGNQQKVAFGRWLVTTPSLLILDEPSRGVDVEAKADLHRLIRDLTDTGMAVLVASSDIDELLTLSDRLLVIRDGRLVTELAAADADEQMLVGLAAGHRNVVTA
ncbi:sugar ABC transporter ATP-binding protein [Rhodococcus sp. NPDC127528]|uniref:sugar ABC transporter ATP-binding protein n=1 Tax=unclassified Rhodococcus (in: high G+C Gram-positive bacteria) TaxID=192944 RepID=UPI0036386421